MQQLVVCTTTAVVLVLAWAGLFPCSGNAIVVHQQQPQQQPQQVARPPVATTATQNGTAAAPAQAAQAQGPRRTLPAFDLYLDLPHPAASSSTGGSPSVNPPRVVVVPPAEDSNDDAAKENQKVAQELSGDEKTLARIARFAFPEFDDQAHGALLCGRLWRPNRIDMI